MNDDNHSQVNTVSAIVVCFNEEERIGDCLESLRWCDEIVVVDSFSTDRTPEICRRYTDRFIQRKWAGYRDQKGVRTFAGDQGLGFAGRFRRTGNRGVAEESRKRSGPATTAAMPDTRCRVWFIISTDGGGAAVGIPTTTCVCSGASARLGVVPSHMKRFSSTARCAACKSSVASLFLSKYRRSHAAHQSVYFDLVTRIEKEGGRWRLSDALLRPAARFFRSYIFKRGFMEGFAGFYVAVTAAVYVFLKYAKLWELELEEKKKLGRKR